jgi:ParB-like chromosome segregation protein Spo0J
MPGADFQMKIEKIADLKPHEQVRKEHYEHLLAQIKKNRFVVPIIVDSKHKVILDGHHRYTVLKALNFKEIPAIEVDYFRKDVRLFQRRKAYPVSKRTVISRALSGRLFPPKTTRHIIKRIKEEKIPLSELKI